MRKKKFNAALYKAEEIAGIKHYEPASNAGEEAKNDKKETVNEEKFKLLSNVAGDMKFENAAWFQSAVPGESAPEKCVGTGNVYTSAVGGAINPDGDKKKNMEDYIKKSSGNISEKTIKDVTSADEKRLKKVKEIFEKEGYIPSGNFGENTDEKEKTADLFRSGGSYLQDDIAADGFGGSGGNGGSGKDKDGKNKKNKNSGGLKIAVAVLSVALALTGGLLSYVAFTPGNADYTLEASYKRAFSGTVTYVDNMDLYMSKILATKDSGAKQKYLSEVIVNAELCENGLQELPLNDESKFYTAKLVNQVGDYSKFLNKKLIDGGSVSSSERESYKKLHSGVLDLKDSLATVSADFDDINFSSLKKGGVVLDSLDTLQNISAEYPELIYDGPFSDGKNERIPKGIAGDKVTEEDVKSIITTSFKDYGVKDVKVGGKNKSEIESFVVTAKSDTGDIFAMVSETGGKIILFTVNYGDTVGGENGTDEASEEDLNAGYEFLKSLKIDDMKAVWSANAEGVSTINYAYELKGVICYSDLIKVKVVGGKVVGMEATSYYLNHTERTLPVALFDSEECKKEVFEEIEITSCRKALVPAGTSSEVLCYEYAGVYDDITYYVYISAIDKKQVEMFKVVSGTEGELLM